MIHIAAVFLLGFPAGGKSSLAQGAVTSPHTIDVEVVGQHLDVFDQPDDRGFIIGRLGKGDHLRVRIDRPAGTGWLAITPLPTSILWIEESSLDLEDEPAAEPGKETSRTAQVQSRIARAWVKEEIAIVRSGHPLARLPGPRKVVLPRGTLVQLIDRPPLELHQGTNKIRLLAIVPPPDQSFFVHADGIRWPLPTARVPAVAEVRATYEEPISSRSQAAPPGKNRPSARAGWPPALSAELARVDGMFRLIVASQPVAQWRFETVRAGYQNLLRQAGDRADVENALRTRLAQVTQHERAARAARTIESILARSHRRDVEVAAARSALVQLA
ncbi:MAG: hypothetical protein ACP5XB_19865, partial [Isosphaeraceae bacterium]